MQHSSFAALYILPTLQFGFLMKSLGNVHWELFCEESLSGDCASEIDASPLLLTSGTRCDKGGTPHMMNLATQLTGSYHLHYDFSCPAVVPVVTIWLGIFPLIISPDLAIALSVLGVAACSVMYRVRTIR